MIQDLIALAKDIRAAAMRGEEDGLTPEELAFYDALAENDSAVEAMGNDQLRVIAHELVEQMRIRRPWTGIIRPARVHACGCW